MRIYNAGSTRAAGEIVASARIDNTLAADWYGGLMMVHGA